MDAAATPVGITDRGFTLADGIFDTLLVIDGQPLLTEAHLTRLQDHARQVRIPLALSVADLRKAALTLIQKNGYTKGRYALRTTLTRGPAPRGLLPPEPPTPTLLMTIQPAPAPDTIPPIHAFTAGSTRRNEHSPLSRIKSLQYGDNLLALMEARDKGGNEAVLLNTAGHAACATAGNIFIREGGKLITPPLKDGVLNGIVRETLLRQTETREESLTVKRIQQAEAIYITSSLSGVRGLSSFDGRALPGAEDPFLKEMITSLPQKDAA